MKRCCFLYVIIIVQFTAVQAQEKFLSIVDDFLMIPHNQPAPSLNPSDTDPNGALYFAFPDTGGLVLTVFDTDGYTKRDLLFKTGKILFPDALEVSGNHIITAGITTVNGSDGIFVLKTDTLGKIIWFKTFGNPYHHFVRCLAVDAQGNIMVGGNYDVILYPSEPKRAFFLLLDASGAVKKYSAIQTNKNYPSLASVIAIKEGGFMFNGQMGHNADFFSSMVIKTDAGGNIQWLKTYRMPLSSNDYNLYAPGRRSAAAGGGIAQINADRFVLGGYVSDHDVQGQSATFWWPYLAFIDAQGNFKLAKSYHNPDRIMGNHVFSVKLFSDNSIYLAGTYDNYTASFLMKTDLSGYPFSERLYDRGKVHGAPRREYDALYSISESPSGNCWVSGTYGNPFPNQMLYYPIIGHVDLYDSTCLFPKAGFTAWDLTLEALNPPYQIYDMIAEVSTAITSECTCFVLSGTVCGDLSIKITLRYAQCEDKQMTLYAHTKKKLQCDSTPYTFRWTVTDTDMKIKTYTGDSIKLPRSDYYVHVEAGNKCKISGVRVIDDTPPVKPQLGADTTYCDIKEVIITPRDTSQSFLWSTGVVANTITVSTPGTYWARSMLCPDIDSITLNFVSRPNIGPDQIYCESMPAVKLRAEKKGFTYNWSTGETTPEITVNGRGLYWAEISNDTCTLRDSMNIYIVFDTALNIGRDTFFCIGNPFDHFLHAGISGTSTKYLWSTKDTTQDLQITSEGEYWIRVTQGNCMVEDTITITKLGQQQLEDIDNCLEKRPEFLDAGNPGAQYLWSTGESTQQIPYPGPGQFWVKIDVGSCQFYDTINIVRAPEDIVIHIPSAFTPNNDESNNVYTVAEDGVKELQVDIYNRWGEHLYSSDDIQFKWDGMYQGAPVPEGLYYYVIRYRTFCDKSVPATRSGVIHLLR